MASENSAKLASIESVSSLAVSRNQHPNMLKTSDQLLAGISVVIGELSDGGLHVILTSVPRKYYKRKQFKIRSIHGYQTELPGDLGDRNRLCADLLGRRGDPVILCHSDERERFHRDVLPELRLEDGKVDAKHWKGSSDRRIEDLFADMQRAKDLKSANADKPGSATVTGGASRVPTRVKRKRPFDGPLVTMLEAQAKRCCCKKNQQSPGNGTTERRVSEDEEKSPEKADIATTEKYAKKTSSSDSVHSTEVKTECRSDESADDKRTAVEVKNVLELPKTRTRGDDKTRSAKRRSTTQSLISFKKMAEKVPDSHTSMAMETDKSTTEEATRESQLETESTDDDSDVVVVRETRRYQPSMQNKSAQDKRTFTRKSRRRNSGACRGGCGARPRQYEGARTTAANDTVAQHVISDDSDESPMEVDKVASSSARAPRKSPKAPHGSTSGWRPAGARNTMLSFLKKT